MKKVYLYHSETHEYLGEQNARIDCLESEATESLVWLLPADATFIPPPLKKKEGYALIFEDNKWIEVFDNRGVVYQKNNAKRAYYSNITEPIFDGFTRLVPCEFPKWDGEQWIVDKDQKKLVEIERLIENEIRKIAVKSLIKQNKISKDYK